MPVVIRIAVMSVLTLPMMPNLMGGVPFGVTSPMTAPVAFIWRFCRSYWLSTDVLKGTVARSG